MCGVQLVNVSKSETRNLIVQAGAFAEHEFTELTHSDQTISVESKYFAVQLPPGPSPHLCLSLARLVLTGLTWRRLN